MWSICRKGIRSFWNPTHKHQIIWLSMMIPKSSLKRKSNLLIRNLGFPNKERTQINFFLPWQLYQQDLNAVWTTWATPLSFPAKHAMEIITELKKKNCTDSVGLKMLWINLPVASNCILKLSIWKRKAQNPHALDSPRLQ